MSHEHAKIDFYINELAPVVDGKITSIISDGEGMFGLEVTKNTNRWRLWILQDDEGNGPGSFSLETL